MPLAVDGFEDGQLSVVRDTAERVQDHPIDPAKDCGGGGNTERQGKHCDRCPGRGSAEDTRLRNGGLRGCRA